MTQLAFDTQIPLLQILPGLAAGEAHKILAADAAVFTNTLSGVMKDAGGGGRNGLPASVLQKVDGDLADSETLPLIPSEKDAQIADALVLTLDLEVTRKADSETLPLIPSEKDAQIADALALTLDLEVTRKDDDGLVDELILGDKAVLSGAPVTSHLVNEVPLDDDLQQPGAPIRIQYSGSDALPPGPKDVKPADMNAADFSRPRPHSQPPAISIEAEPIPGDAETVVPGDIAAPEKMVPASDEGDAQPVARNKSQSETDTLTRLVVKDQDLKGESRIPATSAPKGDAFASLAPEQTAKPASGNPSKLTGASDTGIVVPDAKNTDKLAQDIVTGKSVESDGASRGTKRVQTSPTEAPAKQAAQSAGQTESKSTDDIKVEISRGAVPKGDNARETLAADAASNIQKSKARNAGRPNVERNAPQPLASQATVEEPVQPQGSDTANAGTPEPVAASQTRMTVKNAGTSTDKIAGAEAVLARSLPNTPDAAATAARGMEATSTVANRPAETTTTEPTPRFIVDLPKPLRVPSQIRIRLEPPELGAVRIDLQAGRNGIVGTLRFHSDHTRSVVERDLGQLHRALHEAGVRVERLEIAGGRSAEFRNSLNSETPGHQQWSQQSSRGQYQQTGPQGNPWQTDSGRPHAPSAAWQTAPETMGIINRDGHRGVNLVA